MLKKSKGLSEASAVSVTLDELISLSQPAAGLKLLKSTARALQSGQYLANFKGRGMEFDETRLYTPGDDVRSLDWRVTARTGKAHTKLFREERERPIFLSVDFRSTMFFATRGMFKSAMAARLAGLLAWSAQRHGDRLGGQLFSEAGSMEFKPDHGHGSVLRFLKQIASRERPPLGERSVKAFEDVLVRLPKHAKPGSMVFVISDFRDLNQTGEAALGRLSKRCDMVLIMISDPLEQRLPSGFHCYGNGRRDLVLDATRQTLSEYAEKFQHREEKLRSLARRHDMRFVTASTTEQPLDVLRRGMRRQRKVV